MHPIVIGIILCLAGREALGARILGLLPAPAKSHLSVTSPIMHALAERGHDVTMFVPFTTGFKAPNYREIIYANGDPFGGDAKDIFELLTMNFLVSQFAFYHVGTMLTEFALNSTAAQDLIRSEDKYDIIVMEHFVNEAFFVYAHKFKCPVVLISAFGTSSTIDHIFGNPTPYSYVASEFLSFTDRMTFFQRLQNTLAIIYADVTRKFYYMPRQQALAEKYFSDSGITIPPLEELERQSDFILINTHHAFGAPRPYMPNMKNVAGMHLKPAKPLPSDLQQYFDSSKNGVILMSMGSALQATELPDRLIEALKGAFARLPYDVLWKWEDDTMTNKPDNVRLGKWLPQNDILAHPKLKLFVTHGGISSTMETVYHAVPIVGIPVFGDQPRNVRFAVQREFAEILDFRTVTENEAYEKITKVLTDPKYQQNVKKVSAYWRDEINHPLEEAVHWVEYVLRNGGAKHLKAAVTEQNFIQYFLIDVWFALSLVLVLIYFLISRLFRLLCKKKESSPKKTTKKTN